MKKTILRSLTLIAMLAGVVAFYSCDSDCNFGKTVENRALNIAVPDGFSGGITTNDMTYLVKTEDGNKDGSITKVYIKGNRSNGGNSGGGNGSSNNTAVVMYTNGKVKSVTLNDVTYTFHSNSSGKIDVAITWGSISELFSDVAESRLLTSISGNTFAQNLAQAMLGYNTILGVIINVNDMVEEDSQLYARVRQLSSFIDDSKKDTSGLTDENKMDDIMKKDPETVPNPFDDNETDGMDKTADDNTNAGNGAIVSGKGALKVTLTWFFSADIDLHVYEPAYFTNSNIGHIYYSTPRNSNCDGYLDIDNTKGYYINPSTGEQSKSLAAVENIFWNENPDNGTYDIYLHYFGGTASGPCTVTVYKEGKSIYTTTRNIDSSYKSSMMHIGKVTMPSGTFEAAESNNARNSTFVVPFDVNTLPAK